MQELSLIIAFAVNNHADCFKKATIRLESEDFDLVNVLLVLRELVTNLSDNTDAEAVNGAGTSGDDEQTYRSMLLQWCAILASKVEVD